MANVRNYEEYRAEVLDTLGATVEDLRNEPSFRAKVLETLGVEFTDEDTRNFERYRLKALEGLKNGGGGSSDFSTATVTVINNDNTFPCVLEASILQEESGSGGLHVDDSTVIQGNAGFGTNIHRVVLYKGGAFAVFLDPDGVETVGFDIAGDIEERGNSYFITGDCTVTIQSV